MIWVCVHVSYHCERKNSKVFEVELCKYGGLACKLWIQSFKALIFHLIVAKNLVTGLTTEFNTPCQVVKVVLSMVWDPFVLIFLVESVISTRHLLLIPVKALLLFYQMKVLQVFMKVLLLVSGITMSAQKISMKEFIWLYEGFFVAQGKALTQWWK